MAQQRTVMPHLGHNVATAYEASNLVFTSQRGMPPIAWIRINLQRTLSLLQILWTLKGE